MERLVQVFMHKSRQRKIQFLAIFLVVELAFLFVGGTTVTNGGIRLTNVSKLAKGEVIWRGTLPAQFFLKGVETVTKKVLLVSEQSLTRPSPVCSSERTPSALVNAIMALLATFETAGVLPPEGTSQGNQLIHGLIQLQAALLKSQSPELQEYALAAITQQAEIENDHNLQSIQENGLTSKILEALLLQDKKKPIWNYPAIVRILHNYNFSHSDWRLITHVFYKADSVFRAEESSIHAVYEQWRLKMRGNR